MRKKFLKIAIIMVLLVFVYNSVANALSFTAVMSANNKTVPESTEFNVEVKVANLDVGANGISSLSGYLKYDEEIFEEIGETSIEGRNGWSATFNADDNGKLQLKKTTYTKEEEAVFQVTFKTKSEIDGEAGKIEFTNIMASTGTTEINAADISITINIGQPSEEDEGPVVSNPEAENTANKTANKASVSVTPGSSNANTNKNVANVNANANSGTNKNTNKNTNTNKNSNTNKNVSNKNTNKVGGAYNNKANTSTEDIPYTGVEDTIMFLMLGIIAIAIVFYVKFERINKEMK